MAELDGRLEPTQGTDVDATPRAQVIPTSTTSGRFDRVITFAGWMSLALLVVASGWIVLADPRAAPLAGDESSFIYNAISARRLDFSYDARDQADWIALDYGAQPRGLFLQANDHGWALAKPVGFTLVLGPSLWLFGLRGVQIAGLIVLLVYTSCWYLAGRLRWSRPVALTVAVAASIASHAWFYSFTAQADLWFAALVGIIALGCLKAAMLGDRRWFWLASAVFGLLLTEKVPALLSLVPLVAYTAWRVPRRDALVGVIIMILVGLASTAPYRYYSDGESWSPYGGDRFYAGEVTPWSGGTVDDLIPLQTREVLTPRFVAEKLRSPSDDLPAATVTFVIGRNTGVLTFLPIVPALVLAGLVVLLRRRTPSRSEPHSEQPAGTSEAGTGSRSDDDGPTDVGVDTRTATRDVPEPLPPLAWAALLSLLCYSGFYLVLFTNNYYGGGQSVGSRYFLQFSAVAVIVPVAAGVTYKWALRCAAFAFVWTAVVIGPHWMRADTAFVDFWRTAPVQRLLPNDTTQRGQFEGACPGRCVD